MGAGGKKKHESFTVSAGSGTALAEYPPENSTPAIDDLVDEDVLDDLAEAVFGDPTPTPTAEAMLAEKHAIEHHAAAGPVVIDDTSGSGEGVINGDAGVTPADVVDAQTQLAGAIDAFQHASFSDRLATFAKVVEAENHLEQLECPPVAAQLVQAKAQAKAQIDDFLIPPGSSSNVGEALGVPISVDETLVTTTEIVKLARASTPAEQTEAILAEHAERSKHLAVYNTAAAQMDEATNAGDFAAAAVTAFQSEEAINTSLLTGGQTHVNAWKTATPSIYPDGAAAQLRAIAKGEKIGELRQDAVEQGMDHELAANATRAQLQNWMIASWHASHDQASIEAAIAAKAGVGTQANGGPASQIDSKVSKTVSFTPPPGGVVTGTAGSGKWAAKHQQLVSSLAHVAAAHSDLPTRLSNSTVASWTFAKGPAMSLGGAHTKTVVSAPDGSAWMFKPDSTGGARASAEQAANQILHRAGIPVVPVYKHAHGGKPGVVQPLMKDASTFPSNPSQWSQADVDSIVRYHAAAWVIGDHDAKHDNLLRTPSGGLVPIDHGQAFKFWGQDKLSADYHPNSSYGAQPPVWNVLYSAAKNGHLATGVQVRPQAALATIKAVESISDTEFTAILQPVAAEGASNTKINWRSTFSKSGSSNTAIADAFLTHGLQRKNTLRTRFATFFAGQGFAGADLLTQAAR